jgi:hypothetical protein
MRSKDRDTYIESVLSAVIFGKIAVERCYS